MFPSKHESCVCVFLLPQVAARGEGPNGHCCNVSVLPVLSLLSETLLLLIMGWFACYMFSYSFDISLGGENSRISWTVSDMFHSEPSKCWQPEAGGAIAVSGVWLFHFDVPPRTFHVLFFSQASSRIPGCLIPSMLPPHQHLSCFPGAWATL